MIDADEELLEGTIKGELNVLRPTAIDRRNPLLDSQNGKEPEATGETTPGQ